MKFLFGAYRDIMKILSGIHWIFGWVIYGTGLKAAKFCLGGSVKSGKNITIGNDFLWEGFLTGIIQGINDR